jgi:uncharacterized protein (DUF4415 family)
VNAKTTIRSSEAPAEKAKRRALLRERTDAEIRASIADDPDWKEFENVDWSKAEVVVPPKKQAISIRLDQDLIEFFKAQGPGYQRRINAVLRSFMKEHRSR